MNKLGALLAATLWLSTSTAAAYISMEPIRAEIARHLPAIRGCYDEGLTRRPDLAGRIEVAITIESDGHVTEALVQRSTLADQVVEACVLDEVRTMQFGVRARGGFVRVFYPFVFSR